MLKLNSLKDFKFYMIGKGTGEKMLVSAGEGAKVYNWLFVVTIK